MDLLNDILGKLPKPAVASGDPPATPPAAPPAAPAAGQAQPEPATDENGNPLPPKPGGQRLHTYGDAFKEAFGPRKEE